MSGESSVRFYHKETKKRVSHTLKADELRKELKEKTGLPIFFYNKENTDDRYKVIDTRSVFDNEDQILIPSIVLPMQPLSHESYWELCTDEIGDQEIFESVTSLLNIFKKDGLELWKSNQRENHLYEKLIDAGVDKDVIAVVKNQMRSYQQSNEAADRGTRFHSASENFTLGEDWQRSLLPEEIDPFRQFTINLDQLMQEKFGTTLTGVRTEVSFVQPYIGIAGQADNAFDDPEHPGVHDNSIVLDYKFSDKDLCGARGTLLTSKFCFPERALQLGMYALGMKVKNPRLVNVFGNVLDGSCELYEWDKPQQWVEAALLTTMLFYRMKLGSYPKSEGGKLFGLTIESYLENYYASHNT